MRERHAKRSGASAQELFRAALGLAAASALLALPAPAEGAFPGANGRIAFSTRTLSVDFEIYAVNPDGTDQTRLSNDPAHDLSPAWSPDGDQIAFTRESGTDRGIWTANAAGSGQRLIAASGQDPAWSPDGKKIAFVKPGGGIWVMNSNGSNPGPLPIPAQGSDPAWSPDGQKIAYLARSAITYGDIYTVNVDGSGETRLTDDRMRSSGSLLPPNDGPNWSPDGRKIAFTHFDYDTEAEYWFGSIQTIDADGNGRTYITRGRLDQGSHVQPAWSPDGFKIAFADTYGAGIFVTNSDGSGAFVHVTDFCACDTRVDPDWQPINPAPYTRPVGATPTYISLVPAFAPCDPANATHRAPLSGVSCNPPVPRSSSVAVGPRSLGFTRRRVLATGQCAPFDPARCYPDVTIVASLTDVRSGSPTGPDYDTQNPNRHDLTATATIPGEAQGKALRITDLNNQSIGDPTGAYDKAATVVALSFPIPIDCTATSDTSVGSNCAVATTANSLVPGSAVAGKRAIWELGNFQILDQGQNGTPGDSDDRVFEVQGLFAP